MRQGFIALQVCTLNNEATAFALCTWSATQVEHPWICPPPFTAVKDPRYTCVICRGLEVEDAPSANTADVLPAVDAADATSPRRRGQQHARRQAQQQQQQQAADRAELLDDAQQLGVEIPKGLGGAALRSYLLKRQREVEEHGADSSSQEEEADQQQQQQHGHLRGRPPRAVAGAAAHATHGRARRQQRLGASSGSSESGVDEEQRRPKQRKLGGAALASHLRRLEQRRQQRQQQHASDHEQASFGAAEEDGWPYNHIPAPPRKLGGAALKSYIRRQELLLEEPDGSDSEQPATSGQPLTAAEEWPFAHIPPPPRKLGGAALRSYIKRQELLLAEQQGSDAEGGREHQEATSDSEQPSSSHGVAAAADEAWPYTHIPAPPRKLGGAALKSYIRRQEQLLEEQDGGSEPSGSSSGTAEEFGASSSEDEGASGVLGMPACGCSPWHLLAWPSCCSPRAILAHLSHLQHAMQDPQPGTAAAATKSGPTTRRTLRRRPSGTAPWAAPLWLPTCASSRWQQLCPKGGGLVPAPLQVAGVPAAMRMGCWSRQGGCRHGATETGVCLLVVPIMFCSSIPSSLAPPNHHHHTHARLSQKPSLPALLAGLCPGAQYLVALLLLWLRRVAAQTC